MIIKSVFSLIRDSVSYSANNKYRVIGFKVDNNKNIVVECEVIDKDKVILLQVEQIISENKLKYFSSEDIIKISNKISNKEISFNKSDIGNYYYSILSTAFIVCLITANLAATKICNFMGYDLPGGIIIFPLLYIINDVLTEVYGFSASRKVIFRALIYNVILSAILYIVTLLPPSNNWSGQQCFEQIFSLTPRILFASIVSYIIGEALNAVIISNLKIIFKGKFFAIRAILSTTSGSFVESIIFCFIVFTGILAMEHILNMIVVLSLIKVIYEIIGLPITIRVVEFLKRKICCDVFEKPSLAGIFGLTK